MNRTFIYKILLGMVIFNSMLLLLGGFFTVGNTPTIEIENQAVNVTDPNSQLGLYGPDLSNPLTLLFGSDIDGGGAIGTIGGVLGILLSLGGLAVLLATKNYVVAGACLFSALVVFLFSITKNVIFSLTKLADNWIIQGMFTLITICIGLLLLFTLIDMFSPGEVGSA